MFLKIFTMFIVILRYFYIFICRIICNQHFAGLPGGRVDGPSLVPGGLVLQLDGNDDGGAPACAVCACCNST